MGSLPPTPSERQTVELLAGVRRGEDEAWTTLYRLYHDELLLTARLNLGHRLRSALQSEDVLQSVALEAFQALAHFEDRGRGSLRAFLHRLVRNKIRDRADTFDAQKRRGAVPLDESLAESLAAPPSDAELRYHDDERFAQLEKGLRALPAEMRAAIVLHRLKGLSHAEVGARLGRNEAAARKLYSRALARLTSSLGVGP